MFPWASLQPSYSFSAWTAAWLKWRMPVMTARAWTWKPNPCRSELTAPAGSVSKPGQTVNREIEIHVDLDGHAHLVGRLWSRLSKGHEGASFAYEVDWLNSPLRFPLEPALGLDAGTHHTVQGR